MNKEQKEVLQSQLNDEEKVLYKLKNIYGHSNALINAKIKEFQADIQAKQAALNLIEDESKKALLQSEIQSKIYQKQYQEALKKQIAAILDNMNSQQYDTIKGHIEGSYESGYLGVMYDLAGQGIPLIMPIDQNQVVKAITNDTKLSKPLYTALGYDVDKLKKAVNSEISRGIATALSYADIARNIQKRSAVAMNKAYRIARTEGHRVQNQAALDAQRKAKDKGADVVKQWDATLDGRTREAHRLLDGQIRELDEPFEVQGLEAMMPGGFGRASQDVNCRCALLQRARWALDEDELEKLREKASFHGLLAGDSKKYGHTKAKDFADFMTKYLAISKKVIYNGIKENSITELAKAGGIFVNSGELLYGYAKKIKPIDGFDDFTCHATPDVFQITIEDGVMNITPQEYAKHIKDSKGFHNSPIRIISCQSGAKTDGAAQQLADALGVTVLAPTETVSVDNKGRMFVSDNDILAEMWHDASDEDKKRFTETGKWITFNPRKE